MQNIFKKINNSPRQLCILHFLKGLTFWGHMTCQIIGSVIPAWATKHQISIFSPSKLCLKNPLSQYQINCLYICILIYIISLFINLT